jgi:hypothetical protein
MKTIVHVNRHRIRAGERDVSGAPVRGEPSWEQQRWLRTQELLQKKLDCLMSLPRQGNPEAPPRAVS